MSQDQQLPLAQQEAKPKTIRDLISSDRFKEQVALALVASFMDGEDERNANAALICAAVNFVRAELKRGDE